MFVKENPDRKKYIYISIFFIFSPKEFYHEKLFFLQSEKVVEHDMQFFMKKNGTQEKRENKLSFSFIPHVTNK